MKKLLALIFGLVTLFSVAVSAIDFASNYRGNSYSNGLGYNDFYGSGYSGQRGIPYVDQGFNFDFNNYAYSPYNLRRNNFNIGSSISNSFNRDYFNEDISRNRNYGSAYLNDLNSNRNVFSRDYNSLNSNVNENSLYKTRKCPNGGTFYKALTFNPRSDGKMYVTETICDASIPIINYARTANTYNNAFTDNRLNSNENQRSFNSGFDNGVDRFNSNTLTDNTVRNEQVSAFRTIAGRTGRGSSVFY